MGPFTFKPSHPVQTLQGVRHGGAQYYVSIERQKQADICEFEFSPVCASPSIIGLHRKYHVSNKPNKNQISKQKTSVSMMVILILRNLDFYIIISIK